MPYRSEYCQTIIKVTQWKDNCVYKTKIIGTVWLDNDRDYTDKEKNNIAKEHGGDFLGSMSTDTPYDQCWRRVEIKE